MDTVETMMQVNSIDLQVGSSKWISTVRKDAKSLASALEMGYLHLARILYEIETTEDSEFGKAPIFSTWGYKSFAHYVEEELGINRKKAESLRNIWFAFKHQLAHISEPVRERLAQLGWTKVRTLLAGTKGGGPSVLQMYNSEVWVERWVTLSEQCNLMELESTIAKTKEDYQLKSTDTNSSVEIVDAVAIPIENGSNGHSLSGHTDFGSNGSNGHLHTREDQFLPPSTPPEIPEAVIPTIDKAYREVFMLAEEQHDIVKQALTRSSQLSNSPKKGHNLTLICMDFLATNEFTKPKDDQIPAFLAKLEQQLGIKLVALLPKHKKVLFGSESLEQMTTWFDGEEE